MIESKELAKEFRLLAERLKDHGFPIELRVTSEEESKLYIHLLSSGVALAAAWIMGEADILETGKLPEGESIQ